MAKRTLDITGDDAAALRLTLTREALGYTTVQMCRLMGSPSHGSAWSNYEMGRRRISSKHAATLARNIAGLTIDWLYLGRMDHLDPLLRDNIRAILAGAQKTRRLRG